MSEHSDPDPVVVEAVEQVRDRFGASGLRDMIRLAQHDLEVAERAVAELAALGDREPVPVPPPAPEHDRR